MAVFCLGGLQSASAQPTNDEDRFLVLGEFKFPTNSFGVFLAISYKDGLFLFLLDTGCSLNAFDTAFLRELGAPVTNDVVDFVDARGGSNALFRAPAAFVGNLSLQTREPVLCLDLQNSRRASGLPVAGIVGVSFLRQF